MFITKLFENVYFRSQYRHEDSFADEFEEEGEAVGTCTALYAFEGEQILKLLFLKLLFRSIYSIVSHSKLC